MLVKNDECRMMSVECVVFIAFFYVITFQKNQIRKDGKALPLGKGGGCAQEFNNYFIQLIELN